MKLKVRDGVLADEQAIAGIVAASPTAPQWPAAEFAGLLMPDRDAPFQRTLLVAEVDGAVVGFGVYTVLLAVFPPEAEVESLAVLPEGRRKGVGRALLGEIVLRVAKAGAETLLLDVREGNVGAVKLYASAGFVRTGIRKGYYASPREDAISMRLTLAEPGSQASNE